MAFVRVVRPAASLVASAAAVSGAAAVAAVVTAAATASWRAALGAAGLALLVLSWARVRLARWRSQRRGPATGLGPLLARPQRGLPVLVVTAAVLSATWLIPSTPAPGPPPPAGVEWLARPDGSRLAVHVTRAVDARAPPLIFVHGGPGVADMRHDAPVFAALATDRDVWVYDQVGAGASTRLQDVTRYTTDRAVADLEAVRRRTGSARVVLVGHSWGARIVTVYLARHPDAVAALVLSSPGQTPVGDGAPVSGDPTTRLGGDAKARLYARLMWPRNLFVYALTAAAPTVARDAADDEEMDARFAAIYRLTTPALFCDTANADLLGTDGVGYYANQIPQLHPDGVTVPPAAVADLRVPVLVIRPECDYLPPEIVAGNVAALPTARLEVLAGAGHQAYLERPEAYLHLVRTFLDTGQPRPSSSP